MRRPPQRLVRALLATAAPAACGDLDPDKAPVLDETGFEPGDEPPPTFDDGMGEGVFRLPILGSRFSLLVGAPAATVHGRVGDRCPG